MTGGAVALVVGLAVGQGAAEQLLVDPGAGVRYGLPIAMLVLRIASSLTLGNAAVRGLRFAGEPPCL